MVLPISAIEIMRNRLTRSAFQRAVAMAEVFVGADAVPPAGSTRSSKTGTCWREPTTSPLTLRPGCTSRHTGPAS